MTVVSSGLEWDRERLIPQPINNMDNQGKDDRRGCC